MLLSDFFQVPGNNTMMGVYGDFIIIENLGMIIINNVSSKFQIPKHNVKVQHYKTEAISTASAHSPQVVHPPTTMNLLLGRTATRQRDKDVGV